MTVYDPLAAYHEQPWHTVDTLREHCRDLVAAMTQQGAAAGLQDYIAYIERTPGAFRVFGAVQHYLARGWDADHIIKWLDNGAEGEGDVVIR